jgi:hypothetical protein
VLTFSCTRMVAAGTVDLFRRAVRLGAAAVLSGSALLSIPITAHADSMSFGGCVGGWRAPNCASRWGEAHDPFVRSVPAAADETEKARADERDRQWEKRCRPVIAQDALGVPRYEYAAPGCEFGIIQ